MTRTRGGPTTGPWGSRGRLSAALVVALLGISDVAVSQPRIVGGGPAPEGAYPWLATLLNPSISDTKEAAFCGGVLVAQDWVLTAAHCVFSLPNIVRPEDIQLALGLGRLDTKVTRMSVQGVYLHPEHDPTTLAFDLALLQLTENADAEPIAVVSDLVQGDRVLALGFGATSEGGYTSSELRQVELDLLDAWSCSLVRQSVGLGAADASTLCAGVPEGGADTCSGDSGGPLLALGASGPELLGITSYGIGCGRAGIPGIYSRVAALPQVGDWLSACTTGGRCSTLEEVPCSDGERIALGAACDGQVDCADGADESPFTCPFLCEDGDSIPGSYLCDYYPDCSGGEDESEAYCGSWFCLDGTHTSRAFVCDGHDDCAGGSDEDPRLCALDLVCDGGTRVRPGERCDGRRACFDREDESECAELVALQAARSSECPEGYWLSAGVDIDRDGELDEFEYQQRELLCTASRGVLVETDAVAPGKLCAAGGTWVRVGTDEDGDGQLASEEIESELPVCDGLSADAWRAEPLPVGDEDCPAGGWLLVSTTPGDDGGAGVLFRLCNPEPDAGVSPRSSDAGTHGPWLVRTERVPAHASCRGGGAIVLGGVDQDGDGHLQLTEVESETVICDGVAQDAGCDCSAVAAGGRLTPRTLRGGMGRVPWCVAMAFLAMARVKRRHGGCS